MKLVRLQLQHYRNIKQAAIEFHPKLTIFVGQNGMGKTNILEAIHLLSFPRSFRGTSDKLLKQWEADFSRVEGMVEGLGSNLQSIVFFLDPQKKLLIDNQVQNGSDYVGTFLSILFAPEEVNLLSDSPSQRRSFIDAHLSQLSKNYFHHLLNYNKIIKQRNKLLSSTLTSNAELDYWNEQQVAHGSILMQSREEAVALFNLLLLGQSLELIYEPSFGWQTDQVISDVFQNKQSSILSRERMIGHSLLGPHRDDWQLWETKPRRRDLGIYGSRGEQRMSVINLKQAELDLVKQQSGQEAVLLLDDVLSELDPDNQQLLIKTLGEQQTVITTASLSDIPESLLDEAWVYEVEGGEVRKKG